MLAQSVTAFNEAIAAGLSSRSKWLRRGVASQFSNDARDRGELAIACKVDDSPYIACPPSSPTSCTRCGARLNRSKRLEAGSPWILRVGTLLIWQLLCSAFKVSEFIFPGPLRICEQLMAFRGELAKHAWRTDWVTMPGFGIAIVIGVLPGFLLGSSRLAYSAICPLITGFNALPKAAFVPILVGGSALAWGRRC